MVGRTSTPRLRGTRTPSHGFTAMTRARIAVRMIIESIPRCFAVVDGANVRPRMVTHSCTAR